MIVALHSVLKPDAVEGYERDHARLPDDLLATFARLGVRDWSIWRSGLNLFHLVDCDDFEAAIAGFATDAANDRWQQVIGGYVDHFVDQGFGGVGPQPLHLVHSLNRYADPGGGDGRPASTTVADAPAVADR
jgi:L-rhamnose mutarotase